MSGAARSANRSHQVPWINQVNASFLEVVGVASRQRRADCAAGPSKGSTRPPNSPLSSSRTAADSSVLRRPSGLRATAYSSSAAVTAVVATSLPALRPPSSVHGAPPRHEAAHAFGDPDLGSSALPSLPPHRPSACSASSAGSGGSAGSRQPAKSAATSLPPIRPAVAAGGFQSARNRAGGRTPSLGRSRQSPRA